MASSWLKPKWWWNYGQKANANPKGWWSEKTEWAHHNSSSEQADGNCVFWTSKRTWTERASSWQHADWQYGWRDYDNKANANTEWWSTSSSEKAIGNLVAWTNKRAKTKYNQLRSRSRKFYITQCKEWLIANDKIKGVSDFKGEKLNVLQIGLGTYKTIFDGGLAWLQQTSSNTSNSLSGVCIEPVAEHFKKYEPYLECMTNVSLAEVSISTACNIVPLYCVTAAIHNSAIRTNRRQWTDGTVVDRWNKLNKRA